MSAADLSSGLGELADLINFQVSAWQDFGYEVPPMPDCKPVPPLGERSAAAITAGHEAVKAVDKLTRQLYRLREQLVGELRQDEDLRAARVDAMLAERAAQAEPDDSCPAYHYGPDGTRRPCALTHQYGPEYGAADVPHQDADGAVFRVGRCRQPAAHGMTRAWCAISEHHAPAMASLPPDAAGAPFWQDAARRRRAATLLVACGLTAAALREIAGKPGNPHAARDLELAAEVEALTALGLTERRAVRARAAAQQAREGREAAQ